MTLRMSKKLHRLRALETLAAKLQGDFSIQLATNGYGMTMVD